MNRAFVSLYVVIVLSIVVVGWGTDKLFQFYSPEPSVGSFERALFHLAEAELERNDGDTDALEALLSQQRDIKVAMFDLADFAQSNLAEQIESGEFVSVYDDLGQRQSYGRLGNSESVLRLSQAPQKEESSGLYTGLIIAFYVVMAIVVYVWVWPLSRDLKRLQNYTVDVGKGKAKHIELRKGSTVSALAQAFNSMSSRIDDLLASHKEMTYAVSHELRTPLARMKFALEIAEGSKNAQARTQQMHNLRDDVAEMESLINELLTYASFEQDKRELEFKMGDPMSVIEQTLMSHHKPYHDIEVSIRCEGEIGERDICCEWYLFERAINNLVQNAFKYAKKKVRVSWQISSNAYHVAVEDDGQGIDEADYEKVLQAFVRLRQGEEENRSGFGLGLAIVQRIMRWHGGRVSISRSDMGGARFTLVWPRQDS